MASASPNTVLGVVLIALGALLLLGWLDIPFLTEIAGIALIILGILMLMGKFRGPNWLGILLIVLGALVFAKGFAWLDNLSGTVSSLIDTAIAIGLIILGVLKLLGKD